MNDFWSVGRGQRGSPGEGGGVRCIPHSVVRGHDVPDFAVVVYLCLNYMYFYGLFVFGHRCFDFCSLESCL